MIINTKGVELTPPAEWIKTAGKYTLKITEIKPDGFTPDGEKFKIFFKSANGELHSEFYSTAPNMLWKIKNVEVAMKAPECYDIENFVGRYIVANIGMRSYNGKEYAEAKSWEYSELNDKLPPIPEYVDASAVEEAQIAEEAELLF